MQDLSLQSLLPATVSVPKMLLPEITFLQLAFMSYNYPPTFVSNVVIDHRQLSDILDLLTKVHLKAIMPFSISAAVHHGFISSLGFHTRTFQVYLKFKILFYPKLYKKIKIKRMVFAFRIIYFMKKVFRKIKYLNFLLKY